MLSALFSEDIITNFLNVKFKFGISAMNTLQINLL